MKLDRGEFTKNPNECCGTHTLKSIDARIQSLCARLLCSTGGTHPPPQQPKQHCFTPPPSHRAAREFSGNVHFIPDLVPEVSLQLCVCPGRIPPHSRRALCTEPDAFCRAMRQFSAFFGFFAEVREGVTDVVRGRSSMAEPPDWQWWYGATKDAHLPLSILQLDPADRAVLRIAGLYAL